MAKSAFERKFRQDIKRVNKRLKAYIKDPQGEKNIHDVRVSIRRLNATFSLMPKNARSRYRGGIEKYREFLRANSNARDCDIIIGRLAVLGASSSFDLRDKKRAELTRAIILARSLKKLPPRLAVAPDDNRLDKIADRILGRIKGTLPLVLSDDSRVEELHKVRRDLRKLRYILDVAPASGKKKYVKTLRKATGKEIALEELQDLQDLLGSIHDSDITIQYLKGRLEARRHLDREVSNRKQLYQKFVKYMKR